MALFRYSGNKFRLVKLYKEPTKETTRIVEPYLGSGAYILSHKPSAALGIENNYDLYMMWIWLKTKPVNELRDLYDLVEKNKGFKRDIRELDLKLGPQTYLKVNVCSVMVGQLSSWRLYPQHSLPIHKTIELLPYLDKVEIVYGDASLYKQEKGDLVFIDPPYINTSANYHKNSTLYNPKDTESLIESIESPIIFTYGDGCDKIFPLYHWELVLSKKVPNIRKGGSLIRNEYVSYLNFRS